MNPAFLKSHAVILCVIVYLIWFIFSLYKGYKSDEKMKNQESQIIELERFKVELSNQKVELENQIEAISINDKNLFDSYIALVFKGLSINAKDFHQYRISVYKIRKNKFFLLGRYSTNTKFKEPNPNRNHYDIERGFIGKAWEIGEYFIDDLPDPLIKNNDYVDKLLNLNVNIDKNYIQTVRMKSRSYFIKRLSGYDNEPKAIIVFESILPKAFNIEIIESQFEHISKMLVSFIEKIEPIVYEKNIATEQEY